MSEALRIVDSWEAQAHRRLDGHRRRAEGCEKEIRLCAFYRGLLNKEPAALEEMQRMLDDIREVFDAPISEAPPQHQGPSADSQRGDEEASASAGKEPGSAVRD